MYSLRQLAAAISNLPLVQRNATKKQRGQWRKKTDAVPLSALTLSALEEYTTASIRKEGEDQLERGRRITTLNSYFRCARSVFSERMLRELRSPGSSPPEEESGPCANPPAGMCRKWTCGRHDRSQGTVLASGIDCGGPGGPSPHQPERDRLTSKATHFQTFQ